VIDIRDGILRDSTRADGDPRSALLRLGIYDVIARTMAQRTGEFATIMRARVR